MNTQPASSWKPVATSPQDGTSFIWLRYLPLTDAPCVDVVRRCSVGEGFWMGQYESYSAEEIKEGYWQPLPEVKALVDYLESTRV